MIETTTEETKSIMQPPKLDLDPPKQDGYTLEQLKEYDGSVEGKPIWVAIKGVSILSIILTSVLMILP